MKIKTLIYLDIIILLFSNNCASERSSEKKPMIFQECMDVFKDELKCRELEIKSNKEKEPQSISNSSNENKIHLRQEIKDRVQNRNRLFVSSFLGEPDERTNDGAGQDYFIYRRPISRYSEDSPPDKEIQVVFRRDMVIRVIHTPPN